MSKKNKLKQGRSEAATSGLRGSAADIQKGAHKIYKKYTKLVWVLLVAAIGAGIFFYTKQAEVKQETSVVGRGIIEEAVSVTGKIKASTDADLSFEKGGTVSAVYVKEGQKVRAGTVLMTLSGGTEYGSVLEARARVASAQAGLDQLKNGARREELAVREAGVGSAETTLANAYSTVGDTVRSSYNTASDIVRYKTQSFFTGTVSAGYRTNVTTCNSQLENDAANLRKQVELDLSAWSKIDTSTMSTTGKEAALQEIQNYTSRATSLIEIMNTIVNAPCVASDNTLDTVRGSISGARSGLQAATSEITAKKNAIASSKSGITVSQSDLTLAKAGTEVDKIRVQEAAVRQAYAGLYQAQAQASKNVITAPGSGVVTKIDISAGEYASPGKSVVRIVGTGEYTVEADVTESDIARIVTENDAKVIITAIDAKTPFTGKVVSIDPAEQSAEGNPLYRIIIALDGNDARIKSGMTAETTIVTSTVDNILRIPVRFVTKVKGVSSVQVVIDQKSSKTESRDIKTGRRGTDGNIEVVSGLEESELVMLPKVAAKK
jgi:HlyD family secretion protein